MSVRFKASNDVYELLYSIVEKYHPHLEKCKFAIEFVDSKPYLNDRMNLGKVSFFSKSAKLWLPEDHRYDFIITLCVDVWTQILKNDDKRSCLLDLQLCRCKLQYEPEYTIVNGKKKKAVDELGCIVYSNDPKLDDEGGFLYSIHPLDFQTISENIRHYGCWFEEIQNLQNALKENQ